MQIESVKLKLLVILFLFFVCFHLYFILANGHINRLSQIETEQSCELLQISFDPLWPLFWPLHAPLRTSTRFYLVVVQHNFVIFTAIDLGLHDIALALSIWGCVKKFVLGLVSVCFCFSFCFDCNFWLNCP